MAIAFHCRHCRREIRAPDEAAGRTGRCPYCRESNRIPDPTADEEIPLAPVDEEQERRLAEEIRALREQERVLLEEGTGGGAPPEPTGPANPEDLYHHVVNYCLYLAESKLEQAERSAATLKPHGYTALQAVDDFLTGKAREEALDRLPARLRHGFLEQLRNQLR